MDKKTPHQWYFNSNNGAVELVWDKAPEEEVDVKGYKIWRADSSDGLFSVITLS